LKKISRSTNSNPYVHKIIEYIFDLSEVLFIFIKKNNINM